METNLILATSRAVFDAGMQATSEVETSERGYCSRDVSAILTGVVASSEMEDIVILLINLSTHNIQ